MPTRHTFDEDKAELETHFAERVKAYIELGETPEQAEASAREKFGHTEPVLRELRWQRVRAHPVALGIQAGLLWLIGYLPLALPVQAAFALWTHSSQNLGEPGPPLTLWIAAQAVLAFFPASFSVALLERRGQYHTWPIFVGVAVASLLSTSVHDPLSALLSLIPAMLGTLCCITLHRSRKRFKQASLRL